MWVQLYLSYSPCGTCANEIILFTQKRPNCNVFIAFSCLYRHNKEQIHRNGLRLLDAEPRISIKDQPKNYATVKKPELAASTLPGIVRDEPQEIRGNAWTVLNKPREISSTTNEAKGHHPIQDRTKNYATVKKPELDLAASTLPGIVRDKPQEIRGNAWTVLNKPREISSTTNEAKGQPIQVQPRRKKNDMVENGVFPSDSEVSNSSLFDPDQIKSNAIFPPSTADQSQPQEQTVIDIQEDRTKNYSPVKKPKLKPAVSSLPSIVPDISQERRGNARTVLNKPMEISSTTDEAKGQPIQVQPRGKKNDMVENGVFPSDSEVSNSSLIDPDQIRSNAIFPPSTADQSQPQEQTVIDIPEPKEDQEQAVCRKNRRREIVAIIIFVVLISIAIVLLIIFGQWS